MWLYTFGVLAVFLPAASYAAELPQSQENAEFIAFHGNLKILLLEFGANLRIPVIVDESINGVLHDHIKESSAKSFLTMLCTKNNLEWYYDGVRLYITTLSQSVSQTISVSHHTIKDIKEILKNSRIYDDRFPLTFVPGGKIAMVSGPPRYVELVREVITSLDVDALPGEGLSVTVYRAGSAQKVSVPK